MWNKRTHPYLHFVLIKFIKFEPGVKTCINCSRMNSSIVWYPLLYRTTPIFSKNGDSKLGQYVPKAWLFLWQEVRIKHPLPSFRFSGWSENQYDRPGLWYFRPFFETAEWNLIKLNWQEAITQRPLIKFVFRTDRKNKMVAPFSDWLSNFLLLPTNRWMEFDETCQEARPQRPLPSFCHSGQPRWPPWPICHKNGTLILYPGAQYVTLCPSCSSDPPEKHKPGRGCLVPASF